MDCKEFEKMIPAFVANNIEYKELKQFMEHAEKCPDCTEELTIQVLISEGMVHLEDGGNFDLQSEMRWRLEDAERGIRMHKMLRNICITTVLTAILAVLAVMAFVL